MKMIYEAPEMVDTMWAELTLATGVSIGIDDNKNPDVDYGDGDGMWG